MSLFFLLFIVFIPNIIGSELTFDPKDSYYIACGSNSKITTKDGKTYQSDEDAIDFLEAQDKIIVNDSNAKAPSPIYQSARVFKRDATYAFTLEDSGWHWIRLHFLPLKNDVFNLETASFNVVTQKVTLLHGFTTHNLTMKEFLIHIDTQRFFIQFIPQLNSAAFINAIEVSSAPEKLINDNGRSLFPLAQYDGLTHFSFQTIYRVNVGGKLVTSENDTLGRTWKTDDNVLKNKSLAEDISVDNSAIEYPSTVPFYIAPQSVYASAVEMARLNSSQQNFNISWVFDAENTFSYFIRLHFCDIVSKALNEFLFDVYINGKIAISNLDLSSLTNEVSTPNFHDIIVNSSLVDDTILVQIGPTTLDTGAKNAILNGVEIFKMNNAANSLDGEFGPDGKVAGGGSHNRAVVAIGFALMFGAFIGLGAMIIKWQKRPEDWRKRNGFSSWLLPLHAGDTAFSRSNFGSHRSSILSSSGLGRKFTLDEIKDATKNFDPSGVIGVGGFGHVYLGTLDGTEVAIKRGNPQSEQGINEFMTEIQMLSKLRHKHLVSLIGFCDENSEMILVYEYMSNGPLRDHLYGKNITTPLSWKQRLEICIGAARGLHYLHTGSDQGIIHRDVKTTNILLDDKFIAKMADFGLSKDGPGNQANHVSTAVKGSFGYLDPEYFKKQQLTEKSDVYSFGVVLLEVLCARPAINPSLPRQQVNLGEWAMQCKRKGALEKIVDPSLVGNMNPDSMKKFVEAAENCLAEDGTLRPTMGDVLWNLEYALQLQEASSQGNADETGGLPDQSDQVEHDIESNRPPNPVVPDQPRNVERSGSIILTQFNNLSGR